MLGWSAMWFALFEPQKWHMKGRSRAAIEVTSGSAEHGTEHVMRLVKTYKATTVATIGFPSVCPHKKSFQPGSQAWGFRSASMKLPNNQQTQRPTSHQPRSLDFSPRALSSCLWKPSQRWRPFESALYQDRNSSQATIKDPSLRYALRFPFQGSTVG